MFAQIFDTLRQSGWKLAAVDGNWVSATHDSVKRGLLFGNLGELPPDFKPLIGSSNLSQWDVIVFCPNGIESSDLKKRHFPNVQLWYWDIQQGNLFPFPPTNDQLIPKWLKQLAKGNSIQVGNDSGKKHFVPYLTYLILSLNLVVFVLMTLAGGSEQQSVLIAFGAKVNSLIKAGEIWRLFTSMFLHIGYLHLIFNLYALWSIGPFSEERFGHWRFLVIYIMSGLGGAIASYLFSPALSAGASGAIFGLLGALLYFALKRPWLWKSGFGMNLVVVILINFGFGLSQPGIDNFAHLGGLLTGTITFILIADHPALQA